MESEEIQRRQSTLDDYAKVDEETNVEFWYARDIMNPLGYSRWENFSEAIKRAMDSCETSETPVESHFREVTKIVRTGVSKRKIKDYQLTRYACYLIAMNGDSRKEEIAFAQSYFALQTRKQELIEQRMLDIDRITARDGLTAIESLFSANMYERGIDGSGMARIRSRGDKALFGGHDTKAMKKRLNIKDKQPLADKLPRVTIAAKQLATELTNYNMEEKDLREERPIAWEHESNNKSVRNVLVERGIKPEELPPEEDVQKLKRAVKKDEKKLMKETRGFPNAE